MSNKELSRLISLLNNGRKSDRLFVRKIYDKIFLGKYWLEMPTIERCNFVPKGASDIYFVQADDGKFVSAVLHQKDNDLHWFTIPGRRRKGYLSAALREYILPYIFHYILEETETLEISISRGIGRNFYKSSTKLAQSLGFKHQEDIYYELSIDKYPTAQPPLDLTSPVSQERMIELGRVANFCEWKLKLIKSEIESLCGETEQSKRLGEIIDKMDGLSGRLEDLHFSYLKKNKDFLS